MISWIAVVGFLLAFMRIWNITVKIFGIARSVCVLAFAGFVMVVSRFFGVVGLYYIVPALAVLCLLLRYLPKSQEKEYEPEVKNSKKSKTDLVELLGEVGVATTTLSPTGTVKFKSGKYSVVAISEHIPERKSVKCTQITNDEIYVEEFYELK